MTESLPTTPEPSGDSAGIAPGDAHRQRLALLASRQPPGTDDVIARAREALTLLEEYRFPLERLGIFRGEGSAIELSVAHGRWQLTVEVDTEGVSYWRVDTGNEPTPSEFYDAPHLTWAIYGLVRDAASV